MKHAFRWAEHVLRSLGHKLTGSRVTQAGSRKQAIKLTTAFSGIDAPGHSAECLTASWKMYWNKDFPGFVHLSATEWDKNASNELMTGDWGPQCIFNDINEFWSDSIRDKLLEGASNGCMKSEQIKQIILTRTAVKRTAKCKRHKTSFGECTAQWFL